MIIHNLIVPQSEFSAEREMYFRGPASLRVDGSNGVEVPPNSDVFFDTYFNIFPLSKWREYTSINELSFEFSATGAVCIEVVGVVARSSHHFEQCIIRYATEERGTFSVDLSAALHTNFSVLYLRVLTGTSQVKVSGMAFHSKTKPANDVHLAICICTFNRQQHIKQATAHLSSLKDLNLTGVIANNGDPLGFDVPSNVVVVPNRNLGGAGGFARAAKEAKSLKATHISFMDDDIEIASDAIRRLYRFLELLRPDKRAVMISGSMLSAEEKWLQYERNSILDSRGFHHQGHSQDTRRRDVAVENAAASSIRGLAGWWFCTFPAKVLDDVGYPLPIFIRGDDIEFSLRANMEIVSLNGVCVWHEPFTNKYSDLMEDYYLPRNMMIVAFGSPVQRLHLIKTFVIKKFFKNLLSLNTVGAQLNILAMRHFMAGTFNDDPAHLHISVAAIAKDLKKSVKTIEVGPGASRPRARGRATMLLVSGLTYLGIIPGNVGFTRFGFARRVIDCVGRRRVFVYDDHRRVSEVAELSRKLTFKLTWDFCALLACMFKKRAKIRRSLVEYRETSSDVNSWEKLWSMERSSP